MDRKTFKENFKKSLANSLRRMKYSIEDFFFYTSDPFSINCFEQTRREISRMTEEDRERIRKKIDELE